MGATWGANGNTPRSIGPVRARDMIVFQGVKGVAESWAFLEKFYLYGNGYDGARAAPA